MKTSALFILSSLTALCALAPAQAADAPAVPVIPAAQPSGNGGQTTAPAAEASPTPFVPSGLRTSSARGARGNPEPIDSEGNFVFRFVTLRPYDAAEISNRSLLFSGWAKPGVALLDLIKQAPRLDAAATNSSFLRFLVLSDEDGTATLYPSVSISSGIFTSAGPTPRPQTKVILINVADLRSGKVPNYKITLAPIPEGFRTNSSSIYAQFTILYPPFVFDGGSVAEFVAAVEKQYGVDWKILELTPEAANVRVPKMRVGSAVSTDSSTSGSSLDEVIELYNRLSEDNSALGKWKWGGDLSHPTAITLALPMNYGAAPATKVKALSMAAVDAQRMAAFNSGLQSAIEAARRLSGAPVLTGQMSMQPDTKMLIVVGTPAYIDFVESYIEAYTKQAAAAPLKP